MNYPQLAQVDEQVNYLSAEITLPAADGYPLWQIQGRPTAGKSTTLRRLAKKLSTEHPELCVIHLDPPVRSLDSGAIALARVAGALKDSGLMNGAFDRFCAVEYSWEQKIADIRQAINTNSEKVVLLCDEPQEWAPHFHDEAHFAGRTYGVVRTLINENSSRRVVAGKVPEGSHTKKVWLNPGGNDLRPWLLDEINWGMLYSTTTKIVDLLDARVNRFTPLDIRLLIALATISSSMEEVVRWAYETESRRDISRRLANELVESRRFSILCKAWAKVAIIRNPFKPSFVERIIREPLDDLAQGILNNCLIFHYQDDDKLFMHELLRHDAWQHDDWLSEDEKIATHANLSDLYKESFEEHITAKNYEQALSEEMECHYHAVETGDIERTDRLRVIFVDQLNHLGKTLSTKFKRFDAAANVFRSAVRWDNDDDYANHYLAFNLDILAQSPQEIEKHYQKALDIESENVWWWSRWINYLITRARTQEARITWDNALDALGFPGHEDDYFVYEHLHIWVARLLIHRGELDFASAVLRDIPQRVKEGTGGTNLLKASGIKAMERRLKALLEARENRAVFPLSISPEEWWIGPHKSPLRSSDDQPLVKWIPGRIESISETDVFLSVAERNASAEGEVSYFHLDIPMGDFNSWSRDETTSELSAGRFLEVSYYGAITRNPEIYIHKENLLDIDLPPLFPNPQRYLLKRWPRL